MRIRPSTIIIPVYADRPSLEKCIDSLKKYVSSDNKIIIINDCGPEADELETSIKSRTEGWSNAYYYRNPANLGFVKTCNRGVLELDNTKNDILLLNSDTEVTEGFLEELSFALHSKKDIAAVSPRSNNASLATIPIAKAYKRGISRKKSHRLFKRIMNKLPRTQEVPTVHGFCMLIRRDLIKKYGLFDEAFGKGYGEEVDFCMRLRAKGYKSLLANRAYVFHIEARSFSLNEKAKILKKSGRVIDERYPEYRLLIRSYMLEAKQRESNIEALSGYPASKIHLLAKNYLKRVKR